MDAHSNPTCEAVSAAQNCQETLGSPDDDAAENNEINLADWHVSGHTHFRAFFYHPYKILTIHVYLLYILILYNCTTLQGQ